MFKIWKFRPSPWWVLRGRMVVVTRHNYHPAEGYPQTPKGRSNRREASLTPKKAGKNAQKNNEENA